MTPPLTIKKTGPAARYHLISSTGDEVAVTEQHSNAVLFSLAPAMLKVLEEMVAQVERDFAGDPECVDTRTRNARLLIAEVSRPPVQTGLRAEADRQRALAAATVALWNDQHYVVTYQTSNACATLNVCSTCAESLHGAGRWPRHPHHGEYLRAAHGAHLGHCDLCSGTGNVHPHSVLPRMRTAGSPRPELDPTQKPGA